MYLPWFPKINIPVQIHIYKENLLSDANYHSMIRWPLRISSKFLVFLCEFSFDTLFLAVLNEKDIFCHSDTSTTLSVYFMMFYFSYLLKCNMQCYIMEKKSWIYLMSLILEYRDINVYLSMV